MCFINPFEISEGESKNLLPSYEPPCYLGQPSPFPRTPFPPKNILPPQEPPSYPGSPFSPIGKSPLPIQEASPYSRTSCLHYPLHTQALPPPRTPCLPKDPVTAHAPLPECQDEAKQFVKVIFCSLTLLKNNWLYFWLWSHCLPLLTTLQLVTLYVCLTLTCLLQSL